MTELLNLRSEKRGYGERFVVWLRNFAARREWGGITRFLDAQIRRNKAPFSPYGFSMGSAALKIKPTDSFTFKIQWPGEIFITAGDWEPK